MRVDGWSQSKFLPRRRGKFFSFCFAKKTFVLLIYICGCRQFDGFKIALGKAAKRYVLFSETP